MRLHDEFEWIVSHAWSFRFLVLAAVLSGAEAVLPLFATHPPLPPRLFALLMFLVIAAATVARVVVQDRPEPSSPPIAPHPDQSGAPK